MRQWLSFGLFALILWLATVADACAAGLDIVLADHLSLAQMLDPASGPLGRDALAGAVVALVSPGSPNRRAGGPVANLYATLSAGDTVDSANETAGLLQRQLFATGRDQDARIIHFGDVAAPGRMAALRALIARLRHAPAAGGRAPGILLAGVIPADTGPGGGWARLTPVAWLSCGDGATDVSLQPTLTSDTTQTPGLIALRDIAPTILAAESAPVPDLMSGHAAHVVFLGAGGDRDGTLRRMDALTATNQRTLAPFGWVYGGVSGITLFLSMAAVVRRSPRLAAALRYPLRVVVAVPVALMAAPLMAVSTPQAYLAEIVAVAALVGLIPRMGWLLAFDAAALVADALAGTPLVSRSLLSGYWLAGIRFYGVGNEYMGLLIGMALLCGVLIPRGSIETGSAFMVAGGRRALWVAAQALWLALVVFVLAYPQFGAKAGGAVTATATFLPALWARARRRDPTLGIWLVAVVAGFALVFGLSWLAHHFGGRSTHIQAATDAAAHGRLGYIAHVAERKAKMAVRIALAPGAVSGMAGLGVVYWVWRCSALRPRVREYLATRHDLRWCLLAGLWGMLAAALFNDSGSVAALLLFGALALPLLHEMLESLCESSPSMSAMSGSESRSATSSSSAPIRS